MEMKRRLDLRTVLGVLAAVLAAGAAWAGSALASGGSASERGAGDSTAVANVQSRDAPDDDCPMGGGDSEDSSAA